jgi:branched-chain amino acid aminotransferase
MNASCLLNYFIVNDELKNTCDFNPDLVKIESGIYEVFRVIGGKPLFLDEHINRFFRSANAMGTTPEFTKDWVKSRIKILIEANKLKSGNIHFQNLKKISFIAWLPPFKYPTQQQKEEGVDVVSLTAIRENPQIKRTNLPARMQADKIKQETGIHEIILVNEEGLITEGSRSNIFFIKNNEVFTPNMELVLPGITQSKIFEVAANNNIPVVKIPIALKGAGIFKSAFISSTSNQVLPLRKLDSVVFNPKNQVMETISTGFQQLVQENLNQFYW